MIRSKYEKVREWNKIVGETEGEIITSGIIRAGKGLEKIQSFLPRKRYTPLSSGGFSPSVSI